MQLLAGEMDWRWSSVNGQLSRKRRSTFTNTAPVQERYPSFAALIEAGDDEELSMALRQVETIVRPQGGAALYEDARASNRPPSPTRQARARAATATRAGKVRLSI